MTQLGHVQLHSLNPDASSGNLTTSDYRPSKNSPKPCAVDIVVIATCICYNTWPQYTRAYIKMPAHAQSSHTHAPICINQFVTNEIQCHEVTRRPKIPQLVWQIRQHQISLIACFRKYFTSTIINVPSKPVVMVIRRSPHWCLKLDSNPKTISLNPHGPRGPHSFLHRTSAKQVVHLSVFIPSASNEVCVQHAGCKKKQRTIQ